MAPDPTGPAAADPADHLARTTRRVNTVTDHDRPVRLLVLTCTLPAEPAEVWAALVDPDRVARWFLPVSGDLRPGGRFALEGHASGDVLACDEPERISLTWESNGPTGERTSSVDISLRPVPEATVLQLDHRGALTDEQWAEHGPGAVGIGWEMLSLSLAGHLAGGAAPAPEVLAALVPDAATGWADAAVADGDDPDAAAAAARRCVAAYGA